MTKGEAPRAGATQLKSFLRQNWMVFSVLLMAVIVAFWFASQAFLNFLYFNDPRNQDVDRW